MFRHSAGAGDLFASGFLYGLLRNYSLQKCCQMGCLAGGAIVQTLGAEMTPANWKWLFDRYLVACKHCMPRQFAVYGFHLQIPTKWRL